MQKIQASDCVLFIDSDMIDIRRVKRADLPTFIYVCGLITFLLLAIGIVFSVQVDQPIGFILMGGGILFGLILFGLIMMRRHLSLLPDKQLELICSLDLKNNKLISSNGQQVCTLNEVQLQQKFQLTSSAKKLVLQHPQGSITIAKGNPFAGGTAVLQQSLEKYVGSKASSQ